MMDQNNRRNNRIVTNGIAAFDPVSQEERYSEYWLYTIKTPLGSFHSSNFDFALQRLV